MQIDSQPKTGLRIKRFLADEWAMIALLAAAAVQTVVAVQAMNGMVRSDHAVLTHSTPASAFADAPSHLFGTVDRNALASVRQNGVKHHDALEAF